MIRDILTKKQYEIAGEIACGFSEDEIGNRLCRSKDTVHTHSYNLRNKLEAAGYIVRGVADVTRIFTMSMTREEASEFFRKKLKKTLIITGFICIQTTTILFGGDQELRRPPRVRTGTRTTKIVRKN